MSRFGRRADASPEPEPEPEPERGAGPSAGAPTIVAELDDGPLAGRRIDVESVEGRPPKTIEVDDPDGGACRYCLAEWTQAGGSATYTFLYRV
jgi:hypothetical protein